MENKFFDIEVTSKNIDDEKATYFHKIVAKGQMHKVRIALEEAKNLKDFKFLPSSLWETTALHLACSMGNLEAVKLLLDSNIEEFRKPDFEGRTPLHMAVEIGHNVIVKLLIDSNIEEFRKQDKAGWTALHDAAWFGQDATVKLLLDYNLEEFKKPTDDDGTTALHSAARQGHNAIVNQLIDSNIEEFRKPDAAGSTALSAAVEADHLSTVKILLDSKVEAFRHNLQEDIYRATNNEEIYLLLLNELILSNKHHKIFKNNGLNNYHFYKVISKGYLSIFKIIIRDVFSNKLKNINFLSKIIENLPRNQEIAKTSLILNYIFCHYEKSCFSPEQHNRAIQEALGNDKKFYFGVVKPEDRRDEKLAQIIREWQVPKWSPELHICFPEVILKIINQLLLIFSKYSLPKEIQFLIFKEITKSYYEDKKSWNSKEQLNKSLKRLCLEYETEQECMQQKINDLQQEVNKLTELLRIQYK